MQDEADTLFDTLSTFCLDFVCLKTLEAFPRALMLERPAGEWVRVRDLCVQLGLDVGDVRPDLFAVWLNDPLGEQGWAVVLFFDDELKWSTTAHYNRQRLLRDQDAALATQASAERC